MSVLSLAKQSGLVALEQVHQNCLQLESGYTKSWLPSLSNKHLQEEEQLQCSNLNLEQVVATYEAKQRKRKRRFPQRVEGIPVGSNATDYITYRKCHYLHTVNRWRESLVAVMTPQMLGDLMELAISLYRHSKDRLETGAVTLQCVLTCEWTSRCLALTTGYRNSYRPHGLETRCTTLTTLASICYFALSLSKENMISIVRVCGKKYDMVGSNIYFWWYHLYFSFFISFIFFYHQRSTD